jgi:hypothetical protein
VISVDTKKKELIGDFQNAGSALCKQPEEVLTHDFPQDALGQAIPYGIYNLDHNRGYVRVGDCFDTPRFTVESVEEWWYSQGQKLFPHAKRLLILADAGGSNSCRSRVWKAQLQEQLADAYGLEVTVCHYPSGCSKWNPIEHHLFSYISLNWAGKPLRTFETLIGYIRGTTTGMGLRVTASLCRGGNETGERVRDEDMKQLRLEKHTLCPQWNFTLYSRDLGEESTGNLLLDNS